MTVDTTSPAYHWARRQEKQEHELIIRLFRQSLREGPSQLLKEAALYLIQCEEAIKNLTTEIQRLSMALAETEALEMQHGAVVKRLLEEKARE